MNRRTPRIHFHFRLNPGLQEWRPDSTRKKSQSVGPICAGLQESEMKYSNLGHVI